MTIWTLSYSHRYGVDSSLYSTEQKAGAGAIEIMERWFSDLEDHFFLSSSIRRKIRRAMKTGDHRRAIDLWNWPPKKRLKLKRRKWIPSSNCPVRKTCERRTDYGTYNPLFTICSEDLVA